MIALPAQQVAATTQATVATIRARGVGEVTAGTVPVRVRAVAAAHRALRGWHAPHLEERPVRRLPAEEGTDHRVGGTRAVGLQDLAPVVARRPRATAAPRRGSGRTCRRRSPPPTGSRSSRRRSRPSGGRSRPARTCPRGRASAVTWYASRMAASDVDGSRPRVEREVERPEEDLPRVARCRR